MENSLTPYVELTSWLYRNLPFYEFWCEDDYANLISKFSSLHNPFTEEDQKRLAASRFGDATKRLVYEIGTSPFKDGNVDAAKVEVAAYRLVTLWRECERLITYLNANVYAAFILSALRNQVPATFLIAVARCARQAGVLQSSFQWAPHIRRRMEQRLVTSASEFIQSLDLEGLKETFAAADTLGITFQAPGWAILVKSSRDAKNINALEFIWATSQNLRSSFGSREWGVFANTAGQLGLGNLVSDVWAAWRSSGVPLAAEGYVAFARSAARTRCPDVLREVWHSFEAVRSELSVSNYGIFARCAGETEAEDLFESIWRSSAPLRSEFQDGTWGAFADAAGRVKRPDLVREIWNQTADLRSGFHPHSLSSFGHAAGRVGDPELLREVWNASSGVLPEFENSDWSSFAHAAETARLSDLFEEVWTASKQASLTFDHAEWGNFIHAAHSLNSWPVLLDIFHTLKDIFDPTRYTGFGTLYRPLLSAATACPNLETREDMFLILRLQGATIERCLEVMRDFKPQPLAEKGLRFEGAARTLMRYLNYSFHFKSENEFIYDVDRVVEGITSLTQDRQILAWVHLLGRGQESHRMLVRARYCKALLKIARTGLTPWEYLSEEEKKRILNDIKDQTDDGLVGRIRQFILELSPEGLELSAEPEEDPAYKKIVDHIVANNEGYFTGREEENFFENVMRNLVESQADRFSQDLWSRLVRTVIVQLAETTIERMRVELYEAAHDLVKAAGQEASYVLNLPDLVPAALESVGFGVVDTIQCFELMVLGMGERQRQTTAVNIRPVLRMFLETGLKDKEHADVQIPDDVRIAAWHGAKRDLVMRIFGALRANIDRAFQMLPPEKVGYSCRVTLVEGWWRFVIENSFNLTQQNDPFSSGIGLKSVRRRIRLLGGREFPPPFTSSNTSVEPPLWRVNFELRAATEEITVE